MYFHNKLLLYCIVLYSRKFLLEESISGIREDFVCEICKCQALESGIQLGESGILLTIAIQNPGSKEWDPDDKEWDPESLLLKISFNEKMAESVWSS